MAVLDTHPWLLVVFPVVMAVLGIAVSRAAIWALLNPVDFVGIRPLGWQGIVPAKAAKIAPPLVERILARVGTVRDVFAAMDPDRLAEHIVMSLRPRMREVVEDAVLDVDTRLWDELDEKSRQAAVQSIEQELPILAKELLADVDENLDDLVDIGYLTQVWLIDDRRALVRIFEAVGRYSFTFLANAGLLVGLATGLVMVATEGLTPPWTSPIIGFVVMGVAATAALYAVFGNATPRTVGPWRILGVLYRDQDRGSRAGVRIFTRDILTVRNFVHASMEGPHGARIRQMLVDHLQPAVLRAVDQVRPIMTTIRTPEQIAEIEHSLLDSAVEIALTPLNDRAFNRERQVVLEDVLLSRMLDLTPQEFEALVRPAVAGSEWLYVAVSAVAGFLGGAAVQGLYYVLS